MLTALSATKTIAPAKAKPTRTFGMPLLMTAGYKR